MEVREHADCPPLTNPCDKAALTINPKADDEITGTGDCSRKAHSSADADHVNPLLATCFHVNTEANNISTFADSASTADSAFGVDRAAPN